MIEKLTQVDTNLRVLIMFVLFGGGILASLFTDSFWGWIFLIFGFTVLIFHIYINSIKGNETHQSIISYNEKFIKDSAIKYDDCFYGEDGGSCLLINQEKELIYVLARENLVSDYKIHELKFNQIIESGIVEDDSLITKTSKTGLIGRSLLGGIIAGGVGAIIGGITTNRSSDNQVKKLTLTIVVDDLLNPIYYVVFFIVENPVPRDNNAYKILLEKCNLWHKRMSVIIKRNEN